MSDKVNYMFKHREKATNILITGRRLGDAQGQNVDLFLGTLDLSGLRDG